MKKICLFIIWTFALIQAYSNSNRLYHIFVEHEGATYYLSAPYGGGDELVTKKITEKPGDNETFFLELASRGRAPMTTWFYRIKTFRNYYVSLTEDGTLVAEDMEPGSKNIFEVTSKTISTENLNDGGNDVVKKIVNITIGKQLSGGEKRFLAFDPSEQTMVMEKTTSEHTPQMQAQVLDITILTSNSMMGMAGYKVKWVKSMPYDRRPVANAYLKVTFGQASPRYREPHEQPITRIWKINSQFEWVTYIDNMPSITLRTRNETDKAVKLEKLQLWKNDKYYKEWTLNTRLEPGQRIVMFMDGSFKVY